MKESLAFALRVFLKQGLWIVGAAWLLAVGSRALYSRADRAGGSKADELAVIKKKIILGAVVFVVGVVLALFPLP